MENYLRLDELNNVSNNNKKRRSLGQDMDVLQTSAQQPPERTIKKRLQNLEAARRFREKKKQQLEELRSENERLRKDEKAIMMLLVATKKYFYRENIPLRKFPALRDIEKCLEKWYAGNGYEGAESLDAATEKGTASNLEEDEEGARSSSHYLPPLNPTVPHFPGTERHGSSSLNTNSVIPDANSSKILEELKGLEQRMMSKLDNIEQSTKRRRVTGQAFDLKV